MKFTRRGFMALSLSFSLGFLLNYNRESRINSKGIFLPPIGATPDFLSRCIRCGKCAEACPFDSIKLFDISSGAVAGTPYINPLETPCYLCRTREGVRDIPVSEYLLCTKACPTGALVKIKNDDNTLLSLPKELKPGVSVINKSICLAYQYNSCGECYYNCPLKNYAMLDYPPDEVFENAVGIRPYVDEDKCVGCGMCNYVCPVNEKILNVNIESKEKLTMYEERYASMVRNVIGRVGGEVELPAVRVRRLL